MNSMLQVNEQNKTRATHLNVDAFMNLDNQVS